MNDRKHHRQTQQIDYKQVLNISGNIFAKAVTGWDLGYFESVTKKGFLGNYVGLFRVAKGQHFPFLEVFDFSGSESFSEIEAFLVNRGEGLALKLAPLVFWTPRDRQGDSDLALLDKSDGSAFFYKTVKPGSGIAVDSHSQFSDLVSMGLPLREVDFPYPDGRVLGLNFLARS